MNYDFIILIGSVKAKYKKKLLKYNYFLLKSSEHILLIYYTGKCCDNLNM